MALQHERTADQEAEAIAAERIKSGASDHKKMAPQHWSGLAS